MLISIIIPTLNRPNKLISLLDRLIGICPEEEIIIVDDSKNSQAEEIKNRYSREVTYIHRGEKLGVCSARNFGAKYSTSEYLIFFDDDDDFTNDWLPDFKRALLGSPDLVFCDMEVETFSGKRLSESAKEKNGIVIPGAWLIRKSLFFKAGGFDERFFYAENTELFFRINKIPHQRKYLEKKNFIYRQSYDGGSKNLQNMDNAICLTLEIYGKEFNNLENWNLNQTLGVIRLRRREFEAARKSFFKAIKFRPIALATYIRLLISFFPFLSKRIYKSDLSYL